MKFSPIQAIYLALAFFVVLNAVIWLEVSKRSSNELTVAFLNIGQGDAIFIEAPNGNQMLVDAGPNAAILRELSRVMGFFDRRVDVVLMTHPDLDHIGGFPDFFTRYSTAVAFSPGVETDSGAYNATIEGLSVKGAQRIVAKRGMRIYLDRDVYFDILFPDRNAESLETNTASIVGRLVYGKSSFLLSGDAPESIEKYLVSLEGSNLKSTVLKAGHHGSRTSSSEIFVRTVAPEFSVISAGKNNRYGHPHKEVLDVFGRFKVKTLGTYKEGRVIFLSDGNTVRTK